jgi:O-glycosyl hydrolase
MTTTSSWPRRTLAAVAVGALAVGATLLPDTGGTPTADAATGTALTITPQPWAAAEAFEGWGTSLVWFANATGDYPEALREELYQLVFGEDGLDLNIARYNVGGGNASDVVDYLRPGGAVEGWWAADPDGSATGTATTYANRAAMLAAWDASDPDSYDWDADATQRWWVERLAQDDQISHWEVFANSAPYFMTESGYVSGGIGNGSAEQLRTDAIDDFATYLTTVTEHLEDTYGIEVATVDPLNEPNTSYWSTTLTNGVPTGGRQEGMHVGPARQALLIDALADELSASTSDAVVSAMDETNPGTFVTNWTSYSDAVQAQVGQMNVHTYSTGSRLRVRDLAASADTSLWMSEVEGSWVSGWDPTAIENGLGLAAHITGDLRELDPSAWVLWQPVEDLYNMEPQGENLNWGSILLDLDCQAYDEGGTEVYKSARRVADAGGDSSQVEECGIVTNSKFDVMRNFTKFIQAGDHLIPSGSTTTTAALTADGTGMTLVHTNASTAPQTVTVDLSGFGTIADGATATAYVTTESDASDPSGNALVQAAPVAVHDGAVTLTLPAQSVSSIVVDGVSGVAEDAAVLVDGGTYQLVGVQSGKAFTSGGTGAATSITTPGSTAAGVRSQLWTVHEAADRAQSATRAYVLTDQDGRVLGATSAGTDLRDVDVATAAEDPATTWLLLTTDGQTWSFVNDDLALALEVGSQSTAEGASVGLYGSNGGTNQSWTIRSTTATGTQEVRTSTLAGVAPSLPATVVPTYSWGSGTAVPVAWDLPATWDTAGEVTVTGTATDVFGTTVQATAVVTVGSYTVTDPVSVTVAAGSSVSTVRAALPTTVPARSGASTATFDVPVTWDLSGLTAGDLAAVGTVTVPGSATSNDPAAGPLAATLTVVVTDPVAVNLAPLTTTSAAATYTESGYSVESTRNGVLTDKGWSNWRSGTKNTSDTLTYTWTAAEDLTSTVLSFYADGSSESWPQSVRLEYRDTDGAWQVVPGAESVAVVSTGGAPTTTVDTSAVDAATGLRVVMTARAATHMVVSEVQIGAVRAGAASVADLAALRLDGVTVEGFDPATGSYRVTADGSRYPTLTAVATDSAATVTVVQPADGSGTGTVTVVSADGTRTRTTTVQVDRRVALTGLTVTGTAKVGSTLRADVLADPGDAALTWEWLLDGQPVAADPALRLAAAATVSSSFTVPDDAAGAEVQVRVSGDATGFVTGSVLSAAVVAQPLSSEAGLVALRLDGSTVDGFDPATTGYAAEVLGSTYPTLTAEATDPTATVQVTQPAAPTGQGRVVVTAEDGTVRTYTVDVARRAVVRSVQLPAAAVGTAVTAAVEVDPSGAALAYRWTLDGVTIDGADGASWTPTAAQIGGRLAVEVSATADGFLASTARTATSVVVTAAVTTDGGTGATTGAGSQVAGASSDGTAATARLSTTGSAALPVLLVALALAGTGAALLGTRLRARRARGGAAL